MLGTLRKNTKLIIWSVIVSFMLWGGYSVGIQFQKKGRIAGEVFGKEVSFQEYARFERAVQIFSYSGNGLENPDEIRRQAWQNITFSREAKRRKLAVTDEEVRHDILRLLSAQKIENPTPEIYRVWLQNALRESPQDFESQIRELLRIQKMIALINEEPLSQTPSLEEAKKRFTLDHHKLHLELVKFTRREDANAFYEKVKKGKKWNRESKKLKDALKSTGLLPLPSLSRDWQIPEAKTLEMIAQEEKSVMLIEGLGSDFTVVYIAGMEKADETKFEKEFKNQYLEQISNRMKFERFITWSEALFKKANLKDYLPQAENPSPSA